MNIASTKTLLTAGLIWSFLSFLPAAAQDVDVRVDGDSINFTHQEPIIRNSRVLIPLRGVFEEMGATVVWHSEDQTITATRGSDNVLLKIGSSVATVNGIKHNLDAPPRIEGARTLVPLRFISESLNARVEWEAQEKQVLVYSDGEGNLQPKPDQPRREDSRVGIVKESQPSIYMQGSHRLEDAAGNLLALLSEADSDVDLDRYLGERVKVSGQAEPTVEGDMTHLKVESVERI
jgi:copper amine oxidase-like protein